MNPRGAVALSLLFVAFAGCASASSSSQQQQPAPDSTPPRVRCLSDPSRDTRRALVPSSSCSARRVRDGRARATGRPRHRPAAASVVRSRWRWPGKAVAWPSRRSSDQVAASAAAVANLGVRTVPLVLDVTDEGAVVRGVASIAASLGPVDVLVSNAGIAESAPFSRMTPRCGSGTCASTRPARICSPAPCCGMLERR